MRVAGCCLCPYVGDSRWLFRTNTYALPSSPDSVVAKNGVGHRQNERALLHEYKIAKFFSFLPKNAHYMQANFIK
jgi:hypothetical protein